MRRSRINPISVKRKKQQLVENELKRKLYIKQDGKCKKCGRALELHWAGWHKHEIVFRSQGGDPLDPNNCVLLHNVCGMGEHNIKVKSGGIDDE